MTNFIFKSANRLIKNSPITIEGLDRKLFLILQEQRRQRSDIHEVSLKIQKLLIDKHLQMQVDNYFEPGEDELNSSPLHPDDKQDLD